MEANAHQLLEQAKRKLAEAMLAAGRTDIEITIELCQGVPHVEVVRRARLAGADLIVLGRHGRRPVKDMFIGSTVERVLRSGDVPVLIVSRKSTRPYGKPLLAIELKDTARSIVELALRVVGPEVTSGVMVHAYHVPFEGFVTPGAAPNQTTALRREYRQAAAREVEKLQESLTTLGARWGTALVRGDARAVILSEAVRHQADLIILGTHGRTGLAHMLLGSVAQWVVQAASCDVVVTRPARVAFELP